MITTLMNTKHLSQSTEYTSLLLKILLQKKRQTHAHNNIDIRMTFGFCSNREVGGTSWMEEVVIRDVIVII